MNLKEGTRRLALLLGVVGALGGGFVSYLELQEVQSQRARHNRFEQLANSDVVKEQRKTLQSPAPYASIAKPISPPPSGYAINPKTGERIATATPQPAEYDAQGKPITEVNRGGIATINWSNDYEVASIETSDGETLSPTPAPAAWEYLLVVLFPVAGFVIPWGAVRAIGWVGAGFVNSSQ